jgi:hypothetical protein
VPDESNSLDLEQAQGVHGGHAGCSDWNLEQRRKPRGHGGFGIEADRVYGGRRGVADDIDGLRGDAPSRVIQGVGEGQRAQLLRRCRRAASGAAHSHDTRQEAAGRHRGELLFWTASRMGREHGDPSQRSPAHSNRTGFCTSGHGLAQRIRRCPNRSTGRLTCPTVVGFKKGKSG